MTLGKRIGQYRRKLGLTQEGLAQKLDVTNQAVSKWESDQCCPDISLLPRMADIFGITMDELFGREAPVQEAPQPEPESIPEPETESAPEPNFVLVPVQEDPRQSWKDSVWGKIFGKTVKDFEHKVKDIEDGIGRQVKDIEDGIGRQVKDIERQAKNIERQAKDAERKVEKDFGKPGGFSIRKDTGREKHLPEDIELPWEDDQTLRVALFVGKRLISGHPARNRIEFCWEGPALNVYSECSVTCDEVRGNVWAGDDVTCDSVGGSVSAGGDVSCDDVGGYVQAQGDVSCGDVSGNVDAGDDVSCGDIRGDVKAGNDVDCGDVLGHVSAGGDVNCGDVQGNLSAGGDVDCGHVGGFVSAGGDISIG